MLASHPFVPHHHCPGRATIRIGPSLIRSSTVVGRRDIAGVITHRLVLESLPVSANVSRLRPEGKITADMTSVWIGFGAIELQREVRLAHRRFPNGGSWSFFLCPRCDRRVRRLSLNDGRLTSVGDIRSLATKCAQSL
jgi:hypothetical protein